MTTAEILQGALDRLRTRGWIQYGYVDGTGRECAERALAAASCTGSIICTPYRVLQETWAEMYGIDPRSIRVLGLNDDPRTTFADVEAAFEKAIAKAQEVVA